MNNFRFEKVNHTHRDIVFQWLEQLHVREFWDNTQAHKDDIMNFMDGRVTHSNYCGGGYNYYVAKDDSNPFALLMIIQEFAESDIDKIKLDHISKIGNSYSLDFMIGNPDYLGKGFGAKTLAEFIDYVREKVDKRAATFLIDPVSNNAKARHVYEKAGFRYIDDFIMVGSASGAGQNHSLLVKNIDD